MAFRDLLGRRGPAPRPPAPPRRYHETVSGKLSAAGVANITLPQIPPSIVVDVDELAVQIAGSTVPSATLVHGAITSPLAVDTTRTASSNMSSPPGLKLYPGELLAILVRNGTPNAAYVVSIRGAASSYP